MLLLAVDIGNTSCHAGLFRAGELFHRAEWKAGSAPPLDPGLGSGRIPEAVLLASVNHRAKTAVALWARKHGLEPRSVPGDVPYPIEVRVHRPDLVGPDRVLAAAAALEAGGLSCIVVDAGTATTVDLATPEEGFLGGAILPGRALMARALFEGTSRLPDVAPEATEDPLGTSTEGAIRAGAFLGWVGAVKELVRAHRERRGPLPVFLTGGDAPALAGRLEGEVRRVDALALTGIGLAWERGGRSRREG